MDRPLLLKPLAVPVERPEVDPVSTSPRDDPREDEGASPAPSDTTEIRVRRAYLRSVRAGQVLFEIGDPGEPLFVIQAGEVALLEPGSDATPRLLARLGPGDAVAETDVLLGRAHGARAVAVTDARLLQLDRETFREMCLERPEIALRMVERLARRTADLERRLVVLGMNDLVRPVVRALVRRLPPDRGESTRIAVTLRALADAAGLSPREAHRGLGELFERKLVRLVDDALVVPDPGSLVASLEDEAESTASSPDPQPAPR
jgi:CRP-like cAMP-binding protein